MGSSVPKTSAILTLIISISLAVLGVWIAYNIKMLPIEASQNSPVYDELFKVLFIIGTILFIGMVAIVLYSLFQFRRRAGDEGDGIPLEGNISLEIFWTAIPAIVILFVGLYSYDIYDRMGGMSPLMHHENSSNSNPLDQKIWGGIGSDSIESSNTDNSMVLPIELTAMQFAFIFHYPKGDIITGELHVPVGKKVSLKMESKDVIHAFWVPQFRLKQDVIPGQPTVLNFTPTKAGTYPIVCAELCGPYHGGMRSNVIVDELNEYDNWFQQNAKETI